MTKEAFIKDMVVKRIEMLKMRIKDLSGDYRKRLMAERDKAITKVNENDEVIEDLKKTLKILRSK